MKCFEGIGAKNVHHKTVRTEPRCTLAAVFTAFFPHSSIWHPFKRLHATQTKRIILEHSETKKMNFVGLREMAGYYIVDLCPRYINDPKSLEKHMGCS